jgi:hypothetical protein
VPLHGDARLGLAQRGLVAFPAGARRTAARVLIEEYPAKGAQPKPSSSRSRRSPSAGTGDLPASLRPMRGRSANGTRGQAGSMLCCGGLSYGAVVSWPIACGSAPAGWPTRAVQDRRRVGLQCWPSDEHRGDRRRASPPGGSIAQPCATPQGSCPLSLTLPFTAAQLSLAMGPARTPCRSRRPTRSATGGRRPRSTSNPTLLSQRCNSMGGSPTSTVRFSPRIPAPLSVGARHGYRALRLRGWPACAWSSKASRRARR